MFQVKALQGLAVAPISSLLRHGLGCRAAMTGQRRRYNPSNGNTKYTSAIAVESLTAPCLVMALITGSRAHPPIGTPGARHNQIAFRSFADLCSTSSSWSRSAHLYRACWRAVLSDFCAATSSSIPFAARSVCWATFCTPASSRAKPRTEPLDLTWHFEPQYWHRNTSTPSGTSRSAPHFGQMSGATSMALPLSAEICVICGSRFTGQDNPQMTQITQMGLLDHPNSTQRV